MNPDIERLAIEPLERDPRTAPFGIFTGGSFVLDSARVFMWFPSLEALADFLLEVQPHAYGYEGDDLHRYQGSLGPLVQRLKSEGFSDDVLRDLNEQAKKSFVIDWWGKFDEIVAGKTAFAKEIFEGFLDDGERTLPLTDDDLDDLVEYLATCGC